MNVVTGLTDQPNQHSTLILADGSTVDLTLFYRPQQLGWFYNLSWSSPTINFILNGMRLATSPNFLRQYKNQIPFGLMLVTAGNAEPLNQTDLSDGTCTLVLLNAADVAAVESAWFQPIE